MRTQLSKYKIGEEVLALWPPNGLWYKAKIIRINKKSFSVRYTEDNITKRLLVHQLSPLEPSFSSHMSADGNKSNLSSCNTLPDEDTTNITSCKTLPDGETSNITSCKTLPDGVTTNITSCNTLPDGHTRNSSSMQRLRRSRDNTVKTLIQPSEKDDSSDEESMYSSETEYKPSESDDSYVSDSDNSVKSALIPMQQFLQHSSERQSKEQEEIVSSSVNDTELPNTSEGTSNSGIAVMTTNNDGNIRKWDKKQFCYFCSSAVSKLPRHLRSHHNSEPEVEKLISEKDPKRRSDILYKLRNLGNHKHNSEVIRLNKGFLIVGYRPKDGTVKPEDYGPCSYCYGYFVRLDLWRHRCPLKPISKRKRSSEDGEGSTKHPRVKERMASKSYLLKPAANPLSEILGKVIGSMKKDTVGMIVKNDQLILEMGKREYMKLGHDEEQFAYIRTKLRELGRLLLQLRLNTKQPNANLQQFIAPTQFSTLISAVQNVAGFNESTHAFETPSLALKLGHSLKKCALILKADSLEKNDNDGADASDNFIKLCEMKWETEISTHALRTLYQYKRNNPEVLPTMADVVSLTKYLEMAGDAEKAELCALTSFNDIKKAFDLLNEIVICQIILFNRRRQGEVSKMTIEDFNKKHFTKAGDTIILTEIEKNLCKMFEVVEVVGKKGTTVPILLTKELTERITILLDKRIKIGIPENNKFLFARSNYQSLGHIRGSDALRKHSLIAEVKTPESMRSTKLRKQVATAAQMLALSENQIELLATYMGHDIRVHREYYQLPDNVLRVTKLSRLFIAMEKGTLSKQQGKSLDEIEITEASDSDGSGSDQSDNEEDEMVPYNKQTKVASKHQQALAQTRTSGQKRTWTEDEITAVRSMNNILHLRLPGKRDIESIQNKFPVLKRRTWKNIKDYCRNNRKKLLQ